MERNDICFFDRLPGPCQLRASCISGERVYFVEISSDLPQYEAVGDAVEAVFSDPVTPCVFRIEWISPYVLGQ